MRHDGRGRPAPQQGRVFILKLALTGANGFTGRHFRQRAKAAGYDVHCLQANLLDADALRSELQGVQPQFIVHLAAISFVAHADAAAFYSVNVVGTTNLLDALCSLETAPEKVLLASSANVYGNCEHSPISEAQAVAPVNHYAMSKVAMEMMARTYAGRLPVFFTRPFNYTGPGQAPSFLIPKLVSHFARRAEQVELGNLHVEREFNDVRFVCDSYLRLLDKAETGEVYNVCSGRPVTLQAVISELSRLTGHEINVAVNPAFVRSNEVHRLCGSPEKLFARIGAQPIPALDDTLQWMLQEYLE